jgi:predicted aldo/keto reductase-like oxidoreductase
MNEQDPRISRRKFIRQSAAITGAVVVSNELLGAEAAPAIRTAADWVPLGNLVKEKITIPRLGMGTGSRNGAVQRELGQSKFNDLMKYAYERGIRYFDTAKNYQTYEMIGPALKANKFERDKIFILHKMPSWNGVPKDTLGMIDQYRRDYGVDYLDLLLIHCTTTATWPTDLRPMMDAFDEAQQRGWIRAKGMSCHGLRALREATKSNWIEVQLARINPQGRHVDQDLPNVHAPEGKYDEAMKEIKAMHAKGRGIIAMKLCGNGEFVNAEDREKAVQHAVNCGFVDAMVMGFKNNAEIDEHIERVNRALKATRAVKKAA